MRMTLGQNMAKQEHFEVLAGAGGVALGEARTNHEGRKAILLVRGNDDVSEFCGLVNTMGIDIIETLNQPGQIDPRGYFGKGRLQDVGDELKTKTTNHPWHGVDLKSWAFLWAYWMSIGVALVQSLGQKWEH